MLNNTRFDFCDMLVGNGPLSAYSEPKVFVSELRELHRPRFQQSNSVDSEHAYLDSPIGKVLRRAIDAVFYVRSPLQTQGFILEHLELLPVLLGLPRSLKQYYPNSTIYLSHSKDPEEGDELLGIEIVTAMAPVDAYERMEAVDVEVWLPIPRALRAHLMLTLGFV